MQKEMASEEQSTLANEIQHLKDDNSRLKSQLKEAQSKDRNTKDLRSQIEWLTKSEKRLKEEIQNQADKLRQAKTDLARKD